MPPGLVGTDLLVVQVTNIKLDLELAAITEEAVTIFETALLEEGLGETAADMGPGRIIAGETEAGAGNVHMIIAEGTFGHGI